MNGPNDSPPQTNHSSALFHTLFLLQIFPIFGMNPMPHVGHGRATSLNPPSPTYIHEPSPQLPRHLRQIHFTGDELPLAEPMVSLPNLQQALNTTNSNTAPFQIIRRGSASSDALHAPEISSTATGAATRLQTPGTTAIDPLSLNQVLATKHPSIGSQPRSANTGTCRIGPGSEPPQHPVALERSTPFPGTIFNTGARDIEANVRSNMNIFSTFNQKTDDLYYSHIMSPIMR